jgi:hypothetical protein
MSLDGPGETAAFANARDIDRFHICERVDFDLGAHFEVARGTADFADETLGFAAGLGENFDACRIEALGAFAIELGNMTAIASTCQSARLIGEAQLDCFVSVSFYRADLQDVARASLDDRHRDHLPSLIVELRHPDLAAEYSDSHRSNL